MANYAKVRYIGKTYGREKSFLMTVGDQTLIFNNIRNQWICLKCDLDNPAIDAHLQREGGIKKANQNQKKLVLANDEVRIDSPDVLLAKFDSNEAKAIEYVNSSVNTEWIAMMGEAAEDMGLTTLQAACNLRVETIEKKGLGGTPAGKQKRKRKAVQAADKPRAAKAEADSDDIDGMLDDTAKAPKSAPPVPADDDIDNIGK